MVVFCNAIRELRYDILIVLVESDAVTPFELRVFCYVIILELNRECDTGHKAL
eukprot:COSAG02_NODE_4947_length_4798_cov_54.379017_6_plen_53_part_00